VLDLMSATPMITNAALGIGVDRHGRHAPG
jgi:hypothetical protein